MAYHLEGRLLEVCNCRVLCPCWIGEDPDFGTCDTIVAWHFDKGTIDGVDVSDRTIAMIAHIPGNILQGNWQRGRLSRRTRDARAGGGAARRLHRQERRAHSGSREARRRSRFRRESAGHVHRAGRPRDDQARHRRLRRSRAVHQRLRPDDDVDRYGVLDGAGRAGVRREGDELQVEEREARHRSRHHGPQRAAEHVRVPPLAGGAPLPAARNRRAAGSGLRMMSAARSATAPAMPAQRRTGIARCSGRCCRCSSSRRGPRCGCGAQARTDAFSIMAAGAMSARLPRCAGRCRRATSWCRPCSTLPPGC